MSPCIMGLTKQDPYILKEHRALKNPHVSRQCGQY